MRGPKYWSWAPEGLLRDPLVRRMSAEAFGGFMSLLIEAWFDPEGSLPDDQAELAILSRLGGRWSKHGPAILSRWTLAEDGRWHHDIVDDAISRAAKKSEQAQKAVEAREEKKQEDRKVEPKDESDDHQTIIQGKGKEKEKEKEKIGGKPPSPPEGIATTRYSPGFEAFWEAWRALKPKTTLNKKGSFESYKKALQRGATDDDLLQAVKVFGRYVTHREKTGKVDQRDFIPMPETWLNQDRWTSEYPDEVVENLVGDPVSGRDFYWDSVPDPRGDKFSNMVGRFRLGPNGERTGEPFNDQQWREDQKKNL